jgi:hypothetical protein
VASERDNKVFPKTTRGFFVFESSFRNCFWNNFSISGLSHFCIIRNVWKLPSPFSRNIQISSSEKTSWSLKKSSEVFSELEIRIFLENGLGSFQTFLILQISDKPEVLKRFQKKF